MEAEETEKKPQPTEKSTPKRAKRSHTVEPRTPLKRQRTPVQRFQSRNVLESVTPKGKTPTDERVLLYDKGNFLCVRNETESFFICKAVQNVYKTSKNFKVQWLSLEQPPNIYKLDYFDSTELECVLSNVQMERVAKDTYRLPHSEEFRVASVLKKALNVEKGLPINQGVEEIEEETAKVKKEVQETEPSTPKKARTESPKHGSQKVKGRGSGGGGKQKRKIEEVEVKRKGPDHHLHPDARIIVIEKEPMFETSQKLPFISKQVQGKLAIRSVLLNDMNNLKSLIADNSKVHTLDCPRSVANLKTALHYAIEKENKTAIQLLAEDYFCENNERIRNSRGQCVLLDTHGIGRYSHCSRGVQHIQSLTMGRGSREGNNAFTKDLNDMRGTSGLEFEKYLDSALKRGVSLSTLNELVNVNKQVSKEESMSSVYCKVHLAVLHGHRKLAGQLIEEAEKLGGLGFHALHKEVLLFEKEELGASVLPASVKKKPVENFGMTPLHCAATNPNTKYISRLLSVEPDFNLPDKAQRRPIHYAAVCEGTAPLELLFDRGASANESDTQGMTPLHFACQAGRIANVELLLKKAKNSGRGKSDFFVQKYGIGGINRPNRASLCPIHIAVDKGHVEVVRCLIRYKVEINKPVSAGKEKLTPLMLAACRGYLDIVRLLVENNTVIEQPDKMKRTALIHAVMNGNAHVASYLLRMGADGNRVDSSGNSAVHYAAAYGWFFCLKLLLESSNADPNKENDWKVTPVAIAFLKGHLGNVDYLLGRHGVDINFKDDKGMSLVSIVAASPLVTGLFEQLQFLVQDKGVDTTSADVNGYTALHYLCQNNIKTSGYRTLVEVNPEAAEISVKIGELLIKSGCDPLAQTGDGQTPLMLAIEQANVPLAILLLKHCNMVSEEKTKEGKTILHLMAEQCMEASMGPLVNLIAEQNFSSPKKKCDAVSLKTEKEVNGERETTLTKKQPQVPNCAGDATKTTKINNSNSEKADKPEEKMDSSKKSENAVDVDKNSTNQEVALDLKISKQEKDVGVKIETIKQEKDANVKSTDNEKPLDLKMTAKKTDSENPISAVNSNSNDTPKESASNALPVVNNKDNGREKDDKIPQIARFEALKPTDVRDKKEDHKNRSGKVVLESLGKLTDNNGFTPFLRACQKYKEYGELCKQTKGKKSDSIRKRWSDGRQFLETLLHVAQSDVNAVVIERVCHGDTTTNERDQYGPEGKSCGLHFLAGSSDGVTVDGSDGGLGVKLLLKCSPKLDQLDVNEKSALIAAIEAGEDQAAIMLLEAGASPNLSFRPDSSTDKITPLLLVTRSSCSSVGLLEKLVSCGANVNCSSSENGYTPCHYIIENTGPVTRKLEKLRILLAKGANINAQDKQGMTVLHSAVKMNPGKCDVSLEVEEVLIAKGANLHLKDRQQRLPLHYLFCNESCVDPVELTKMITGTLDEKLINEVDNEGQTALHKAAFRGATVCCSHLLKKKADINIKDKYGNTALSLAVLNKHDSCAIMLIQKGARVKNNIVVLPVIAQPEGDRCAKWRPLRDLGKETSKEYPIFQGALEADLEGVAHMMLDSNTDAIKLDRTSAVEAALSVNKFYLALRLLKSLRDSDQVQSVNPDGRTLLHILSLRSSPDSDTDLQLQIADLLLKKGLSVSKTDKFGCTPLIYCGLNHHYHLGKFLLEKFPNVKPDQVDKFGRNVMAATFWNINDLEGGHPGLKNWIELLQKRGCSVDLLCDYPAPDPLLFGYTSPLKGDNQYFVKHSDIKLSPLIVTILNSEFELAQFLLKHGASPNFFDSRGLTPLMYAIKMNDVVLVKLLLNNDFDPEISPSKQQCQARSSKKMSRQLLTISPEPESSKEDMPTLEKVDKAVEHRSDTEADMLSENNSDAEDRLKEDDFDNNSDDGLSNYSEDEQSSPNNKPKKLRVKQKKKLPTIIQNLIRQQRERRVYKSVEKTSSIDLSFKDHRGWTAIHHLVCPLDLGSYDNEEILYVLHKAGAPLLLKDSASLTALDHALIRGAPKITNVLQELTGVDKSKMEKPIFPTQEVDGVKLKSPPINIDEDFSHMMKETGEVAMETDSVAVVTPDSRCNIKGTGEVVYDKHQGIPYDVLLSRVDVGTGLYGTFNYYKMQIVSQKGQNLFVLFSCCGRIGETGQFQHTPFTSLGDAVKEFSKIFKSKTGNEWANFKNFAALPKKYRVVLVTGRRLTEREKPVEIHLNSSVSSSLPSHLQTLIKLMSNSKLYEMALMTRLHKQSLLEAREILQQIAGLIRLNGDIGHCTMEDQYQENLEKMFSLSSEYYLRVPHGNHQIERLQPITTSRILTSELDKLNNLLDYECAVRILLAAQFRKTDVNSLDYIYQAMGCQLQLMNEKDVETQYILKYIYNSCSQCKVERVYRVSRSGEEAAVRGLNLGNHMLLWHGSGLANVLSILKQGLRVAPPDTPVAGNNFGKGIYFENTFEKAVCYCKQSHSQKSQGDSQLMLLCEVALGKAKETEDNSECTNHTDSNYNSVLRLGQKIPDQDFDVVLPYGAVIPLGPLVSRIASSDHYFHADYNQYIIHNPSQICMRYLVQFRN